MKVLIVLFPVRSQDLPVAPEEAERSIRLHERELPLVEDVHVVEGVVLQGAVALVDQAHVQRQVHVCSEAEHVLLS